MKVRFNPGSHCSINRPAAAPSAATRSVKLCGGRYGAHEPPASLRNFCAVVAAASVAGRAPHLPQHPPELCASPPPAAQFCASPPSILLPSLTSRPRRPLQLNIANPTTGCQKTIEIDDDKRLRTLYEKRLAAEVDGIDLGDEFKGYVFKIAGGQDKQGFSMKQGVLTQDRVRLMMRKGEQGCRGYGMRKGEAYRKSVRGCIISHNISVLHLVIVKKGDDEIPGLTDNQIPRRLGPKRASKLRKLFALTKDDDVRKYVIRRELTGKEKEGKKPPSKAPKIQRLVTPISLQRKRHRLSLKKNQQLKAKAEAAAYEKLVAQRKQEAREKHNEKVSQRRSARSSRASEE